MPSLNESDIPTELWTLEMLHMPRCLSTPYKKVLREHGLWDAALNTEEVTGPVGGRSQKETFEHFSCRYGVSASRVQSVVLDPKRAFGGISDDVLSSLSRGHISILDIPCGTGAVGASLLSTVAVLRENKVLPRLPLDVAITGGDFSPSAREIYEKMVRDLELSLKRVGIGVTLRTVDWDATLPDTTARLVDTWFANSADASEYLAVVANFSGDGGKNFTSFQRSFEHVQERLHDKRCTMIWVEPKTPGAVTFLGKIRKLFRPWTTSPVASPEEPLGHAYDWYHPFQQRRLPCTVLVSRYERR